MHRFASFGRCCLLAIILVCTALSRSTQAQAPAALAGHTSSVAAVAAAADGKTLVSAGFDRTIRFWDGTTGTLLRTLEGHQHQVLGVALSTDGRTLISASRDGTVKLWDAFVPGPLAQLAGQQMPVGAVAIDPKGEWLFAGGAAGELKAHRLSPPAAGAAPAPPLDFKGHSGAISRVAISKDGVMLVSADADGQVRFWNAADAKPQGVFGGHTGPVTGLALHPANPLLLTSGADGTVKLWSLPLAAPKDLAGNAAAVPAVALSTDSKLALTGGADKSVRLFDAATGMAVRAFEGQLTPATSVAFSPDMTLVAGAAQDGVVKFWNTADAADRLALRGHVGSVREVAFHPLGKQVVTAGEDGTVRLWRLPAAARPLAGHTLPVFSVAVSPDGKVAATASADKSVRLWNTADGAPLRTLASHADAVRRATFRPDNLQAASGDAVGVIRLWNVADGVDQGQLAAHDGPVSGLAYLPAGLQLVSAGEDGLLKWWQLPAAAPRVLAGHTLAVNVAALSPDGKLAYTGGADASLRVFDVATGQPARQLAGQVGPVTALAIDKSAAGLVAAASDKGEIRFWKGADGTPFSPDAAVRLLGHDGGTRGLAFHPGGQQLASADADGLIRLWTLPVAPKLIPAGPLTVQAVALSANGARIATAGLAAGKPAIQIRELATGAVVCNLAGHEGAITGLAFSPDGTKLASASADKTARVWNLADPAFAQLTLFEGHKAAVTAVAFSADGAHVFSGGADNAIRQWAIAGAAEVRALPGHTAAITDLAVAGAVIVSGAADNTVRLWNAANGQPGLNLPHGAAVVSVAISADGKVVASSGADKTIKLWNAADGKPLAAPVGSAAAATTDLSLSADGAILAGCAADGVRVWDNAGRQLERLAVGLPMQGVAVGAGQSLIAIAPDNAVQTLTRSVVRAIPAHQGAATAVAFSPDGAQLISAGLDKAVRSWTVSDGKAAREFAGPTDAVTSLALGADGSRLLAACADKTVYVWNLKAAAAAGPIAAEAKLPHEAPVRGVHLSADGLRAAACADDGQVHLWNVPLARRMERLPGHVGAVLGVAISPDGKSVVTAGSDKSARVFTPAALRVAVASTGKLTGLSPTADGAKLVTSADDKLVKLWETAADKPPVDLPGAAGALLDVAIRGDGTQVAAAGADSAVYLWPVTPQGPQAFAKIASPAAVSALKFSPDGSRLAVTCADNLVRCYDSKTQRLLELVPTAAPAASLAFLPSTPDGESLAIAAANTGLLQPLSFLRLFEGHTGAVEGAKFTPDGTKLLTGGADKTVRVWSVADAKPLATLAGPTLSVTGVAVSRDGLLMAASGADKSVYLWKTPAEAAPAPVPAAATLVHLVPVRGLAFGATGSRLATCADDGLVRVWDTDAARELERFAGPALPAQAALAVAFGADNKTIVSGWADKSARVDSVSATRLWVADAAKVNDAAFTPDGAQVITAGDDMLVKLWDLEGKPVKQLAGGKAAHTRLAVRPDALQVAAVDTAGRVDVWTLADAKLVYTVETGAAAGELAYSPDNLKLAVAGANNLLKIYNPLDGKPLQELKAAAPLTAARFTPDSRQIVTGGADKSLSVWAYASPVARGNLAGHVGAVYSVASGDKWLASAGADASVRLWDLATGAPGKQLAGHTGPVYSLAASSDGKQLLSGGADGALRLWDAVAGAELKKFVPPVPAAVSGETAPPAALLSVALQPGGKVAASAGSDGQIRLWDVATGQPGPPVTVQAGAVYRVAFSANGTRLLSVGHSGRLVVWNVADGKPLFEGVAPHVAYDAQYTFDGTRLIIAAADGKVHLLDLPAAAR